MLQTCLLLSALMQYIAVDKFSDAYVKGVCAMPEEGIDGDVLQSWVG